MSTEEILIMVFVLLLIIGVAVLVSLVVLIGVVRGTSQSSPAALPLIAHRPTPPAALAAWSPRPSVTVTPPRPNVTVTPPPAAQTPSVPRVNRYGELED